MKKRQDLSGKTFDQQLELIGNEVGNSDLSPNVLIPGEIVLEPMGRGVRVTARDGNHRILWGFTASKDMLNQPHCPVAIYSLLQELLARELKRYDLPYSKDEKTMEDAERAIAALQAGVDSLKASIKVKKVSAQTRERAYAIACIAKDANRTLSLESSYTLGKKADDGEGA